MVARILYFHYYFPHSNPLLNQTCDFLTLASYEPCGTGLRVELKFG